MQSTTSPQSAAKHTGSFVKMDKISELEDRMLNTALFSE